MTVIICCSPSSYWQRKKRIPNFLWQRNTSEHAMFSDIIRLLLFFALNVITNSICF